MPGAPRGGRIRNARAPRNHGTLACLVRARGAPQERFILSAGHVLAMNGFARHGDAVEYQAADGRWLKVAEFERFVAFRGASALQLCDAAIARVTNDAVVDEAIAGIGSPRGVSRLLYEGLFLKFNGATSGLVEGLLLHSTGNVVPVIYNDIQSGDLFTLKFEQQILYGRQSGAVWTSAAQSGDSGALVLNQDGYAVAMHIAVTPDDYPLHMSVCTPIPLVLDALEVDLAEPRGGTHAAARFPTADEVGQQSINTLGASIRSLLEPHNPYGGVAWQLSRDGLIVDGKLDRTPGKLVTVPRVWQNFGTLIGAHAKEYNVPLELVVATICTESGGNPRAFRTEPKWQDDASTPHQVSAGLMQTLISTARHTLGDQSINRAALLDPDLSIRAGTAYINQQRGMTKLDPPVVACAYNAGHPVANSGAANRWKMLQYPVGTGEHADRFVKWFNDCTAFMLEQPKAVPTDVPSFFKLLRGG